MTATPTSRDEECTVGEAADILGVSTRTVRRYEAQGLLTARRLPSKQRRFRRADVEKLRVA